MSGKPNTAWLESMIKKHGSKEAVTKYMQQLGAAGGKKGTTGGFAYAKANYSKDDPRHPANSGRKGGKISKRGPTKHRKVSAPKDSKVTKELGEKYEEVISEVHAPRWLRDTASRLGHFVPRRTKTESASTSDRR